jgi:hypothetical protein
MLFMHNHEWRIVVCCYKKWYRKKNQQQQQQIQIKLSTIFREKIIDIPQASGPFLILMEKNIGL